jgi:hypothetical protein
LCSHSLALAYQWAGRFSEAIALYESTLKRQEATLGAGHADTLESNNDLASAYESLYRWSDAEAMFRDTLTRRPKSVGTNSPLLAGDLALLAHNLILQSRFSEAEPLLRACLAIRQKVALDDWRHYEAMSLLGGTLLEQRRYAEAEPLVAPGYEGMKAREARISVPDRPSLLEAAMRVVRLYEAWGKPDKSAAWKIKLGMRDLPMDLFAAP